MKSAITLVLASLLMLSGCAGSQPSVVSPAKASAHHARYAQALSEAFSAYELQVQAAAGLTYSSQAEAEAVMRTLSANQFDWQLRQALVRRGLDMEGLAELARIDAAFFHAQQQMYWGKLEQLETVVTTLPMRVRPVVVDESLLAIDMSN